jgi:hypothetical protein
MEPTLNKMNEKLIIEKQKERMIELIKMLLSDHAALKIVYAPDEPVSSFVTELESELKSLQEQTEAPAGIKSKENLAEDLCKYCPLEKKGVYSMSGGFVAGCEGSRCDDAYENYLSEFSQPEIDLRSELINYEIFNGETGSHAGSWVDAYLASRSK